MTPRLKTRVDARYPCIVCDYKRELVKFKHERGSGSAGFFLFFGSAEYSYVATQSFQCMACGFKFKEDEWSVSWPCSYCGELTTVETEVSGIDLIRQLQARVLCWNCEDFLEDYAKDGCAVCHDTRIDKEHHPGRFEYDDTVTEKRWLRGVRTLKKRVEVDLCALHVLSFKDREGFDRV